jgi:1-phosphofructokinase family hexose kinase
MCQDNLVILTVTIHPALDKVVRVPRLLPGDAVRASVEMVYGGGKGNNVARALNRLGIPVTATGFQGGYTGQSLIAKFAEEGIRVSFVTCRAPTRSSVMIIEEETMRTYSIYEPGQTVEADELENFRAHFYSLLEGVSLVLFCGSAQTPELAALYFELIHAAQKRGIHCALDSSGLALREGIKAKPYLLKVNHNELAELTGYPLTTLDNQINAMLEIHHNGIHLVALTRGQDGLLLTDGQTILAGTLRMNKVVNVMGCGDSLLAGMASVMLDRKDDLEMIVRRGVACGAANTQFIGAGFIDPLLVQQLESQVDVHRIETQGLQKPLA